MGLSKQISNQGSLVRSGVPLPPWWTLATVLAAVIGVVVLIFSAIAPSSDPAASAAASRPVTNGSTQPATPSSTSPSSPTSPSTDTSDVLSAYVLSGPLPADEVKTAIVGPSGGQYAMSANVVTTATAAAVSRFNSYVFDALPVADGVTLTPPARSTADVEVDKVQFTGLSSGTYQFTVTLKVDGSFETVQVGVSQSAPYEVTA